MAGLPRTGPTPLGLGVPEEIFSLEILVRLPSKDLVRCRAVCRAWRRVASARDLLQAHHRRQPSLPIVLLSNNHSSSAPDLHAFDHRTAAAGGGEARLQLVARANDGSDAVGVEASCDGLLLLSVCNFYPFVQRDFICNPTTRQIGRVPEIHGFLATGLYRHPPTGEYRLLLHTKSEDLLHKDPFYVFALGCSQPLPRCIGCTPELSGFFCAPVVVRGNLHWSWWPVPVKDHALRRITVFDTTAESFRLMRSPMAHKGRAYLYEADHGTLGTYGWNDSKTAIDIWVLHDYDSEAWSRKYHVKLPKLPVAEIGGLESRQATVIRDGRDVFVLYSSGQALFLVDTKGTLLASSQLDGCTIFLFTQRIKESLVRHSFFSVLQGASDDCSSIISWPEGGV